MADVTKIVRFFRKFSIKAIEEDAERHAEETMVAYDELERRSRERVIAERLASGGLPPDFHIVAVPNETTGVPMWEMWARSGKISTEPRATEDSYNTLRELAWLVYNNGIR